MPTPDQVRAAITALYRVRAVEKPAEPDGTREVWHRSGTGVDLLSVVDFEGKLSQQELTLFGDVLHWSRRGGLRSGRVHDPSSKEPSSGDGVRFDPAVSPERLQRAHEALASYPGQDPYLRHLDDLLSAAREGRTWTQTPVISKVADSQPMQLPGDPRTLRRVAVIVTLLVCGVLGALALLLLH